MKGNIGIVGDLHLPFERPDYLNFCIEIFDRCKCTIIVQIGDLVDLHALNFHLRDPDGMSANDEMSEVDKRIKRWIGAFPQMYICLGNHDRLIHRQAQTIGIPTRAIKSFREMWNLPLGWQEAFSWEFYGVRFMHGTGL